jgi:hypothetical protein
VLTLLQYDCVTVSSGAFREVVFVSRCVQTAVPPTPYPTLELKAPAEGAPLARACETVHTYGHKQDGARARARACVVWTKFHIHIKER